MLRIGQVEPSATADGKYTDGSVAGGIAATRLRAAAFNAMQEELANIVESAGMLLSPDDMTQVLTALKKQFLSRANPFADIKTDGPAAVAAALSNLQLGEVANAPYIKSRGGNANGSWTIWSDGAIELTGMSKGVVNGLATINYPIALPYVSRHISIAEHQAVDTGPTDNYVHVSTIIGDQVTKSGFKARCTMAATGTPSSSGFSWRVYCAPSV